MIILEAKGASKERSEICKSAPKSTQNRLKKILENIHTAPRGTAFGGEQLKYTAFEMWSKTLTKKDRVVYGIERGVEHGYPEEYEIVVIYQYLGHYNDK